MKEQINSSRTLSFDSSTNAHDIAGLIKEFLRELPEPLLTRDLYLPFLNIRTRLFLWILIDLRYIFLFVRSQDSTRRISHVLWPISSVYSHRRIVTRCTRC